MGFRFQRRVNLGRGLGLNLSKSGIGTSFRSRYGSIGSTGFSLRSGIPGLTFRQGWGKGGQGALVGIVVLAAVAIVTVLVVVAFRVISLLAGALWEAGRWCALTARDYFEYKRTGVQHSPDALSHSSGTSIVEPGDRTLADIIRDSRSKGG